MDLTFLLQDLLSPAGTQLPASTPTLITYHLSSCPLPVLPQLVHYLAISPSLWSNNSTLDFSLARDMFSSTRDGVLHRANSITTALDSHGWRARRQYAQFIDAYFKAVELSGTRADVRLVMASAALAALQVIKAGKEKLFVGGSALMGRAEKEVLLAWEDWLESTGGGKGVANEDDFLPTWLATQTLPQFTISTLSSGPLSSLLPHLTHSLSSAFTHGNLFTTPSLAASLSTTPEGLHWAVSSESHTHLTTLITTPLFLSLGPLSRSIGRCIEASQSSSTSPETTVETLRATLSTLENLSSLIRSGWASTPWSDASDSSLSPSTLSQTAPWTALKSLLFAITLIHSSLLVVLTPQGDAEPTAVQRELAGQALRILSETYFVTIKFGVDGFGAWKGVYVGFLEIRREGGVEEVERFMRNIRPERIGVLHEREVERSTATFYLNTAESLMKELSNEYVEEQVLQCCKPYFESSTHRDTFEAAHSVLLAIFSNEKKCANDIAPWYTSLLLKAYPTLMSTSQLRLAFTTLIRCVSNSDDALAWYLILQIIAALEVLPTSSSPPPTPSSSEIDASLAADHQTATAPKRDFDDHPTRLDEAAHLSPLETTVLALPRGHLLLTLIDQSSSVNLVLLRSLLEKVWELVKGEGDKDAREALVRVVFGVLGEGLDSTKREEGVRWWMERGEELAPAL
ncbi:peroxisomal membrane protein [Pseudohyphozyma bogoriensis]|nr:peroxisomal membrane protein [Pseudohyphozyma bogoriensis]